VPAELCRLFFVDDRKVVDDALAVIVLFIAVLADFSIDGRTRIVVAVPETD